jgi:hypothetical protein
MPKGTCKLCLEEKPLCDSHYLPKRLYAFGRAKQMKNPSPVVLSGQATKQVSDQLRGYVFCRACEDLFNKSGERWVLANIPHDHGAPFPLQDALGPEKPIAIGRDVNLYDGSSIKAFDMDKLVYFGLSVFWRGAAHDWKSTLGLSAPKVDLCDYFEPLRLFLQGNGPIPDDVVLSVHLWPYKQVWQVTYPVCPFHGSHWPRYWFYVPGIFFMLDLGKNVPREARQRCAHGERKIISVDLESGKFIRKFTKNQVDALEMTDRMRVMLQEISQIRSKTSESRNR